MACEKLVLPASTYEDAEKFLRLSGVDALSLFPDHEGLASKRRFERAKYADRLRAFVATDKGGE